MKRLLIAAALSAAFAPAAQAGMIERACLGSDRGPTRQLCGCIQQVADMTLTLSDQRLASRFFRDPHMAQEIRMSDSRSHESFWERYKLFGARAESSCS